MLHFIYKDAAGETKDFLLSRWKENSRYIQGRLEGETFPRTFRKDRIVEILEGADQLLGDSAPPAPDPKPTAQPDQRPQILFTGFKAADRARLESVADAGGFRVMKTAGKTLAVLCIGYNAGPTKVEAAREAGAFILTEPELLQLIETGELPCDT